MRADLKLLLTLVGLVVGCSNDFLDLETRQFACRVDSECLADRVCVDGYCLPGAEAPHYGVMIRDRSSGDACQSRSPGSDLYAVVIASKDGTIVATGAPVSHRTIGGRGFVFGPEPNDFKNVNQWNNQLVEQGRAFFGQCPEFVPGNVVSMGCGGTALFAFRDAPWEEQSAYGNFFALTEEHQIFVYEHGVGCATERLTDDLYDILVCPRDVYRPNDEGTEVDPASCAMVGDGRTGQSTADVPLTR